MTSAVTVQNGAREKSVVKVGGGGGRHKKPKRPKKTRHSKKK